MMMIYYKLLAANECNIKSYISKNVKCENPCPNALPSTISRAYHFMCISLSIITSSSTPIPDCSKTSALKY
jgi:hypothetical protein